MGTVNDHSWVVHYSHWESVFKFISQLQFCYLGGILFNVVQQMVGSCLLAVNAIKFNVIVL